MCDSRLLTLLAATAAAFVTSHAWAQNVAPPADLHPPVKLDADALRAKLTPSHLGLKPQGNAGSVGLPFGLNYSSETKGVVIPIDQKNEWGVGVGLNINSSKTIELSPSSSLGLQPGNRTPGIMLQKKF